MTNYWLVVLGVGFVLAIAGIISFIGLIPVYRGKARVLKLETQLQANLMQQIQQCADELEKQREERARLYDTIDVETHNRINLERRLEQIQGKISNAEARERAAQKRLKQLQEKMDAHHLENERMKNLLIRWIAGWDVVFRQYEKLEVKPKWVPDTDQLTLDKPEENQDEQPS